MHVPILLAPIVDALIEPLHMSPMVLQADQPGYWVDCTLGGGGHTAGLLQKLANTPHKVLAVDQDEAAIEKAKQRFATEISQGRLELQHCRMSEIDPILKGKRVYGLMADLGFSSDQIDDPVRGLSFRFDGPLDMRLDRNRGRSCYEELLDIDEQDLVSILTDLGEERYSRKIASAILRARQEGRLPKLANGLAELISHSVPPDYRFGRIHPATRTFQALRIWINDELQELDSLLGSVILNVQPGGRVAILSFHSLEDRKVKQVFKAREGVFEQIHKKPIEADEEELKQNPRARSAKLRIAERTSA